MKYKFRGTEIKELDDDRLRIALEKHQQKQPTKPEDYLVYQALVACLLYTSPSPRDRG